MEKMQFSLRSLVEQPKALSFNQMVTILNDVCLGLQYLHSRTPPIVHRDLTPSNILLCNHLRAKIADLGVARTLQVTDTKGLTLAPGAPDFMPPECLADKPVYGLSLDIFSFGGVILYITTQQWPRPTHNISYPERIALTELQRRQQYLDKMTGIHANLKPLAESCLADNPKNRPTVLEALTEINKSSYCDIMILTEQEEPGKQSENQHEELLHNQQQRQVQLHQPQLQQGLEQQRTVQQNQQKQDHPENQEQTQQQRTAQQNYQQEQRDQLEDQERKWQNQQQQLKQQDHKLRRQQEQVTRNSSEDSGVQSDNLSSESVSAFKIYEPILPLFVAKCDFFSEQLSFKKGDHLYIINKDKGDQWYARAKHSGQEGYIPSSYVADLNSLEAEE